MRAAPPGYGDPTGADDLRAALAHWIGRTRGVVTSAEEVVVTSGALHGMDLVTRAMVGPGDVVAVEEPGYPPAVELLRSHGLAVVGVPVDADGLVVDAIPPSARLVYVTPSHQYPLGVVLSHERRLQLLRWAARHDATIVEDDYDSQFRYAGRPLEPLQRLDPDGRVVYLGTFSKVLSPSLRVGFAVVPRSIIPAVTALREAVDWCPPWPTQPTLTRLIVDGHLDRHIARARWQYRARREEIVRRLRRSPVPVRPLPSSAGLHVAVLVDGDDTADDHALHEASVAEDVLRGVAAPVLPVQHASRRPARRLRNAPRSKTRRGHGCARSGTAPRRGGRTLARRQLTLWPGRDCRIWLWRPVQSRRTVVLSPPFPRPPRRYERMSTALRTMLVAIALVAAVIPSSPGSHAVIGGARRLRPTLHSPRIDDQRTTLEIDPGT